MNHLKPNRIETAFEQLRKDNKKALIPFLVAGDPDLESTRTLAMTLLDNGADLLEIGVPFSDPSADGPAIMAADARALAKGIRIGHVFELVSDLRRSTDKPILLLLYFNLVYQQGVDCFFEQCARAGVDGVIIPDLPMEERHVAQTEADRHGVIMTHLVTPLSNKRLPDLVREAKGFLYCVAALGVTGERQEFGTDLKAYSRQLAAATGMPRALGFGISSPEQVRQLAPDWDALIVGSALVRRIAEGAKAGLDTDEIARQLKTFILSLRKALDEGAKTAAAQNLVPSREDFVRFAQTSRLIPVSRRVMADTVTPISLFQRFDDQQSAYLLESVLGGERWARYSIMGRKPLMRLSCQDGRIKVTDGNGQPMAEVDANSHPVDGIRQLLKDYAMPNELSGMGFRCGLVGYFAYDFIRELERLPDDNPDELNLPDCDLMAPAEVVLYDHLKAELTLICNRLVTGDPHQDYDLAEARLDQLNRDLFESDSNSRRQYPDHLDLDFKPNVTQQDYMEQVGKARAYIKAGDIFQVVLSQRFSADYHGDPFAVYRALRHVNPSPYLFYLRTPQSVLIGASPEMLVQLDGNTIETCPIAGTRPRGQTPEEDNRLANELLQDAKELAEHAMLVDLARNDVGRISRFGTVKVKDFCHVERFSHVMHLVTFVEGQLREDRSSIDVLAALLPAGTLSGAPKIRAMEIIDELETVRRGPYGGAVGYLGFDGHLDTCITIRTAVLKDQRIHVQAGAGIVADSVPETEYQECLNKARAVFSAISKAGDFA